MRREIFVYVFFISSFGELEGKEGAVLVKDSNYFTSLDALVKLRFQIILNEMIFESARCSY